LVIAPCYQSELRQASKTIAPQAKMVSLAGFRGTAKRMIVA